MLRARNLVLALGLAMPLFLSGSASAVTFDLSETQDASQVTFTLRASELVSIIGYEFTIQYDESELTWGTFTDLSGLFPATAAPGAPGHDPGGMKAVAVSFTGPVPTTDLFSLSFLIANRVDDGEDDFRIFVNPAGCEALTDGCGDLEGKDTVGFQTAIGTPVIVVENLGWTYQVGDSASAIPEPSIFALIGSALPLLLIRRR